MANRIVEETDRQNEQSILEEFRFKTASPRGLDAKFTDANDDLVADAPADPGKRQSPEALVFSFVAGLTAEEELKDWRDFCAHLSRVTGKPVETKTFTTLADQLEALAGGKLHVTGFNSGAVPTAVTTAGFVPVCTFGHDDGSFGVQMQFIVAARSSIKKLEDLKGKVITFTDPGSNSGCKAALALLQDHEMLPQRDYSWRFSLGHEESIARVASGEYEVAPVASDMLQLALAAGTIKPEQFRVIYESERFPPATMGYAHDLSDELAEKVRQAFLDFDCRGTSLQKRFDASQTTRFVPVSYKQDFALIRRIDASIGRPSYQVAP
ncbi:MAG TPA: phosphate/phosphite/phosphonate ABC transporter substrate-binding protein [Pirellulales bacterium]|nr:phosphate/phosphite/phosphonate ABC transporter substrate-binding protein [Pirellulales bacterium]